MSSAAYSGSYTLDFEQPVVELDRQIETLQARPDAAAFELELHELRATRDRLLRKTYASLTPWQTVRVARHPARPQSTDLIGLMCRDFVELHGDRCFADDKAIVCGFARLRAHKVLLVGHRRGRSTAEKVACNFGCAHPEGYRKALRTMRLAEKFQIPIVTLVDTKGAYPGIGAEQRGQAESIAVNLREMSRLRTPIVSVIIGEGGSGGALGIAVGDRVGMLEHAWYSVISPEGCAAILWKEANETTNGLAASALKLTARDNHANGLVDDVIEEPPGGAHRDPHGMAERLQEWIVEHLGRLTRLKPETLVRKRFEKYRMIGMVGGGTPGG
jgi:acetyl-CoA carboxylase carboxyl transferase subunit alpha